MKIEELELSRRAANVLVAAGIYSLEDLAKVSVLELAKLPNCGSRTLHEIIEVTEQHGVILRDPDKALDRLKKTGFVVSGKKVGASIRVVFQSPDGAIHENATAAKRHAWEIGVKKGLRDLLGADATADLIFDRRHEILSLFATKPAHISL